VNKIDMPKLSTFKNEINSLQKNIEYIEKKLSNLLYCNTFSFNYFKFF